MKTLRTCSIYLRSEALYIFSFSNTPFGFIANTPSIQLPRDAVAEAVGSTILAVLQRLSDKVARVDLAKAGKEHKEHLRELGFKSINAFEKRATAVSVELADNGTLKVVPYEAGPEGGFLPVTRAAKRCGTDAKQLGELVIRAGSCIK